MNARLTRIGAIAAKEFTHLRRDPRVLAMVLVLPIVSCCCSAYAISFDVKNVPTVIVDQDQTAASRAYVQAYATSGLLRRRGAARTSMTAVDAPVRSQRRPSRRRRPARLRAHPRRGEQANVAVLIDGTEPNSAQIGQAYAIALNQVYSQGLTLAWADRRASTSAGREARAAGSAPGTTRSGKLVDFLIPGLMVVIIMIVTVQQTAVTLVRERDLGTQEQMMVSPLRQPELMVGKLLPWTLLAFVDMVVIAARRASASSGCRCGAASRLLAVCGRAASSFASLGLGLIISAVAPTRGVGQHHRAPGGVPARVPAVGLRVPAGLDPARSCRAVSYALPGPLHGRDLARGVPQGRRLRRAVAAAGVARRVLARGGRADRRRALRQEARDERRSAIRLLIWKEFLQLRRDPLLLRAAVHACRSCSWSCSATSWPPTSRTSPPRSSTSTARPSPGSSERPSPRSGYFTITAHPASEATCAAARRGRRSRSPSSSRRAPRPRLTAARPRRSAVVVDGSDSQIASRRQRVRGLRSSPQFNADRREAMGLAHGRPGSRRPRPRRCSTRPCDPSTR